MFSLIFSENLIYILKAPGPDEPGQTADDDLKHPPHIHSLDVQCSKTMMTINIEFNRAFDGVIYSKVNIIIINY